ncbi:response regulator [Desulfosporosinus sp. BICA1-9]|uniref:response regulator n=1 Tax=Desulfosporosinus sp. BICA1-9 TaxID=1531958 RepID=UPI00054B62D8|nr:response regulator [Desulfosporosinus sp. BICA1-9]KJS50555.1 MAG: hypothetical protein VR66_02005 [Peptococcaceae bacterium BRH_c23]KJS82821.1 MAG: hypothetical protein JL57_23650 [Desulfosporosinus sp. BICA1-9]
MYKLLVVEDEVLIRKGIVKSIDWNSLGYEVIGEAVNGSDALEMIERNTPDVVLTDVKMPVMDGLELSRIIEGRYKGIKIIILSGYADFEYAKAALKVHAFDYLLKPTDKTKFIDTFVRLKTELDKEKEKNHDMVLLLGKMNEGLINLRADFIFSLLNGDIPSIQNTYERMEYLELDLTGENFTVAVIKIEGSMINLLKKWGNDAKRIMFACTKIIQELLDIENCGIVIAKGLGELIVVFNFKTYEITSELCNKAKLILNQSCSNIKKTIFIDENIIIAAGLGLSYPDINHVSKSYMQANKALKGRSYDYCRDFFIFDQSQEDTISFEKHWIKEYPSEANSIIVEITCGNTEKARELVEALFNKFLRAKLSCTLIQNYAYVLCFLIAANLSELQKQIGESEIFTSDFEDCIKKTGTIEEIKEYLLNVLLNLAEDIKSFKQTDQKTHRKIIQTVKDFINNNYFEDISLEIISKHVFVSSAYLSFLFKSITGENYTDYLRKVRLEKAKELLSRIDLKVYEIASKVGYNDYKYFSIQFKKTYGLSPTKFREKL